MQTGRIGNLYGLQVHPVSMFENAGTANKCVAFASGKNGIAIVNRLPETQEKKHCKNMKHSQFQTWIKLYLQKNISILQQGNYLDAFLLYLVVLKQILMQLLG